MATKRVRVTLKAFAYVDTADWPDEDVEVEEGEDAPDMSMEDAIIAFEEQLANDEEVLNGFVERALEGGDFDVSVAEA